MDDVAEQHEIADELSDALSNAVGFSQDVSDVSDSLSVTWVRDFWAFFLLSVVFSASWTIDIFLSYCKLKYANVV